MRLRTLAFVVALVLAASPVLGTVCEMDCVVPMKPSSCHESTPSWDGSSMRGAGHPCDHDRGAGSPALIAGHNARAAASPLAAAPILTLAPATPHPPHITVQLMHDPPGLSGGRVPSFVAVLRI